jgi:hypothetical protein
MALILLTKSVKNIPSYSSSQDVKEILQKVQASFSVIPKQLMKLFGEFSVQILLKVLDLLDHSGMEFIGFLHLGLVQISQANQKQGQVVFVFCWFMHGVVN